MRCAGPTTACVPCSPVLRQPSPRDRRPERAPPGRTAPFLPDWEIIGPVRQESFERLYEDHAEQLLGFLVYRTGDRALAEDLMADTFERVLRARRPFDRRRAKEKTWLYAIAMNLVRDHQRRKGAEGRALERVGG